MHAHGIDSMHLICLCKEDNLVYIKHMQAAWGNIGAQWLTQGHLIYQCTLPATCWPGKWISDPLVPKPSPKPPSSKALTIWGNGGGGGGQASSVPMTPSHWKIRRIISLICHLNTNADAYAISSRVWLWNIHVRACAQRQRGWSSGCRCGRWWWWRAAVGGLAVG